MNIGEICVVVICSGVMCGMLYVVLIAFREIKRDLEHKASKKAKKKEKKRLKALAAG